MRHRFFKSDFYSCDIFEYHCIYTHVLDMLQFVTSPLSVENIETCRGNILVNLKTLLIKMPFTLLCDIDNYFFLLID